MDDSKDNEIQSQIANFNKEICSEFVVETFYKISNVGLVVGGTITKGEFSVGQKAVLGPDKHGKFHEILIGGMQENMLEMPLARQGMSPCL